MYLYVLKVHTHLITTLKRNYFNQCQILDVPDSMVFAKLKKSLGINSLSSFDFDSKRREG